MLAVEVNVVRVKKLWPRALLGPFTRSVSLTPADVRAYQETTAATAIKDYQGVEVSFDQPLAGTPVTQRRQAAAAEADGDAEECSEDDGSGNR